MKFFSRFVLAGVAIVLPAVASAQAPGDAALANYISPTYGTGKVSLSCPANTSCSPVDAAIGLRLGHRFDPSWAVELGYSDISADFAFLIQQYSASFKGYSLGAAYTLPVSDSVSLLLRAGVSANQLRFRPAVGFGDVIPAPLTTRSVKPYVGLAASWQLGRRWSVHVDADWTRADLRENVASAKQAVGVRFYGGGFAFHF